MYKLRVQVRGCIPTTIGQVFKTIQGLYAKYRELSAANDLVGASALNADGTLNHVII